MIPARPPGHAWLARTVRTLLPAALLALLPAAAIAQVRLGLRTGYSFSQQVCDECANEDHPMGWLEAVDLAFEIGDRWQARAQVLITALDDQIFHPVAVTDESDHTYRNLFMLEAVREGPGTHRGYLFAGAGFGAYSSYDQYPTTRPGYPALVSASGFALGAGLGYDWRPARWLTVQPEAAYHLTWLGALDLNSYRSVPGRATMGQFTVTVGVAYRSRKLS